MVSCRDSNAYLSALCNRVFSILDSVPTSHGVTDDGMGVAVELELLRYFVKHPPQNTIIFLFNNFEEGGLVGAKHFVNHPWFPTVKLFFNLGMHQKENRNLCSFLLTFFIRGRWCWWTGNTFPMQQPRNCSIACKTCSLGALHTTWQRYVKVGTSQEVFAIMHVVCYKLL